MNSDEQKKMLVQLEKELQMLTDEVAVWKRISSSLQWVVKVKEESSFDQKKKIEDLLEIDRALKDCRQARTLKNFQQNKHEVLEKIKNWKMQWMLREDALRHDEEILQWVDGRIADLESQISEHKLQQAKAKRNLNG